MALALVIIAIIAISSAFGWFIDRTVAPLDNISSPIGAVVLSIIMMVLGWIWWGPAVLILLPVLAMYISNVMLGGGLNDSPLDFIDRWRNR